MAGSPKQKLEHAEETDETSTEQQEVYLKDGRKLTLSEQGGDQLVEIRNESGLVEVRIKLTEAGPVLQMEAVRMQLKAAEDHVDWLEAQVGLIDSLGAAQYLAQQLHED